MFVAFLICLPAMPFGDLDESLYPPITLHDLERFHDARLALAHGSSCNAISLLRCKFAQRGWDQAGWQQQYDAWMKWLQWCHDCWDHLEYANKPTCAYKDRILWLRILRRLIGPDAYYAGMMPEYPVEAIQFQRPESLPMPREFE